MRGKAEQVFVDLEWHIMQLSVKKYPLKSEFNQPDREGKRLQP
jgi:hypothetical protein